MLKMLKMLKLQKFLVAKISIKLFFSNPVRDIVFPMHSSGMLIEYYPPNSYPTKKLARKRLEAIRKNIRIDCVELDFLENLTKHYMCYIVILYKDNKNFLITINDSTLKRFEVI